MFILIGAIGLALLVLALLVDDLLEGVLPDLGWLSMTSIAAFLAAFGLVGYVLDTQTGLPGALAATAGGAAGLGLGAVAARWSRSLSTMATDATPTAADLVGCQGRVITPVPPGSTGEVLVRLAGQQVKLTAVAGPDQTGQLEREAEVVVVEVLSPTRVEVQAADDFWS